MPALLRKKLPIGIQSFAKIREGGFYYVDKTAFALRLINGAGYFFLSRPRRFGKSLFLDTLKEIFEGNRALFVGLAIHDQWDWAQRFPVIRISFGGGTLVDRADLLESVHQQLERHERQFGLPARYQHPRSRFADLLERLHEQTGQRVVVLVDEYDKPILDQIDHPASVVYSYFAALGLDVRVEDATNHGRIDMAVLLSDRIYLFEFKVVELVPNGKALQQLKDKRYADKYRHAGLPVSLVGVAFSRQSRNVVGFEVEVV